MKTIIAGSRSITEMKPIRDAIFNSGWSTLVTEVVSGGAYGVDRLGAKFAKDCGLPVKWFTPDWDTHGKGAGFIRNQEMADYADALIAIWDGVSRGTKDMIDRATKKGLKIYIYDTSRIQKTANPKEVDSSIPSYGADLD